MVNRVDRSKHFKSFDDPFFLQNRDKITIFDFHVHSIGPDSNSCPVDIIQQASRPFTKNRFQNLYEQANTFLDALALSDHDSMAQTAEAAKLAHEVGLLYVLGVELTTHFNGFYPHILLFHSQQEVFDSLFNALNQSLISIPTYLPTMLRSLLYAGLRFPTAPRLEKVMEVLQDFPDILVIVPHPEVGDRRDLIAGTNLKKFRNRPITSLTLDEVHGLLHYNVIDGVEIVNERYQPSLDNTRLAFCEDSGLSGFGFSDAHSARSVGSVASWTTGKFQNAESLLAALKHQPIGTVMQHIREPEKSKRLAEVHHLTRSPILQPA